MKTRKQNLEKLGLLFSMLGLVVLSACTKSIPYEQLPPDRKEHTISKDLLKEEGTSLLAEYLYSASMQNASRTSADALPFSSGDNKRVKLEITEESLRVLEVERDGRFAANGTNNKLILEIPIEHTEFRCATDRFGECTNKEENADSIPWNLRSGMKVKLQDAKSGELDLLPIMISQTVGENCYETVSTRLVSSAIDKTSINFQVERTFKTRLECLSNNAETLSDAIVTANFHYSFVKLNSILSKDFKPVSYPEGSSDERTFGFFSSKRTQLDVDNNKTEKSTIQVMNHWNPNRSEIVYHLSDEFAKPENKLIKDLTFETVNNLNKGLSDAGVKFKINLQEPSGKVPGDIRNSMIVLVEDPVESSVIGYGPQTEDPVTGEIISARTVMFLGTIKKFIKNTYEDILREKGIANAKIEQKAASDKIAAGGDARNVETVLSQDLLNQVSKLKKTSKATQAVEKLAQLTKLISAPAGNIKLASVKSDFSSSAKHSQIQKYLKNYTANVNSEVVGKDLKSQLKYINEAKNCAFAPAIDAGAGGISEKLMAKFPADAKPWAELSADEKNRVVEIILPEIWVPTLIHELGHNLGLRHNFAASEDKVNFLTAAELAANKIDHDAPFSSVMDYGSDLKTLPVLGKYDIAALRFGYLRQVDVKQADSSFASQKISTTLEDLQKSKVELKEYQFCTDEHVGINAGCKRFDLGTSYTEIVKNLIQEYEDAYTLRNFRNGRASMSVVDDLAYASRINGIFKELRIMMEVRERIKYRYKLADDAEEYSSVPFLKDLNDATLLSGAFMANVLLVPDATCAVAKADKPNQIIGVLPIGQLDPEAISCFKASLNPAYVVVAQAGKMFNSKKDPDSTNAYADQIDVRGIWLDKLMAARNLLRRQIGITSFDNTVDNFANISALRRPITDIVSSIMTDTVVGNVTFTFANGVTQDFEIPYDMFESQVIAKPMIPVFGKILGIRQNDPTELQHVLGAQFASGMADISGAHEEDRDLGLSLAVKRYDSNAVLDPKVLSLNYGTTKFVAEAANTLAIDTIKGINISRSLEKLNTEKVAEILKDKLEKSPMPETATEDEKSVWALSEDTIQAFVDGEMKSSKFLVRLLQILPNANE